MTSISGTRVNPETGKALNPEQQGLLDSQNESEEYEGMSPLAMGLLQAGASMMRSGGWRNTPMTTGEAIGHAIPAGIGGYYNQDVRNQQGEAELYERQQAEQLQKQAQKKLDQEVVHTQGMIAQLETISTKLLSREQKRILKSQLLAGGKFAEEASAKIMEILTQKRAGEPYLHEELGWVQEDKDGKLEILKEKDKDFKGSPLGTFEIGTDESNAVLKSHGITTAPEGTKYIDSKPITVDKKVLGSYLVFKDDKGDEIESADDTDSKDKRAEYKSRKEFLEENPNWTIPDNAVNVALGKDGKILGYQVKDSDTGVMSYLGEHEKGWQQASAEHGMLMTELMPVAKFKGEYKGVTVPEGTVNVEVKKDGTITFKNKQNQEVSDPTTTVLALQDPDTQDTYFWVVDKNTGAKIKQIDLQKKFNTPIERLKWNVEKQEKESKRKSVDALLDDLKQDFDVSDTMIGYLKNKSVADIDGAITEINKLYTDEYSKQENIKRGSDLLARYGGDYNKELYYKREGDAWVEYRPHSSERLSGESGLRKEYNQLTRDFRVAARGYDGVIKGLDQKNGFGDIMAITSFRIMFEPNSVVREAEFEITSKGAGWWEDFKKTPQKFMDGDKLSDQARKSMKALVDEYMVQIKLRANKHYSTYSKIAKDRGYVNNAGIQNPFSTYDFQASGSGDNYDDDFGVTDEG